MQNYPAGGLKPEDVCDFCLGVVNCDLTVRGESFETFCEFELFAFGGEDGAVEKCGLSGLVDVEEGVIFTDCVVLRGSCEDIDECVDEDVIDLWSLDGLISLPFERSEHR